MPLAAYGGRRDIMDWVAPLGPVYQAGTLAGNPVAVSAGIATLSYLKSRSPYKALDQLTAWFTEEIEELAREIVEEDNVTQVMDLASLRHVLGEDTADI